MNNKAKLWDKVTVLPLSQQVALWLIFRMDNVESDNFKFASSKFANKFKPLAEKHLSDIGTYGKFVGATLSGLMRNGILIRIAGGRDKVWMISNDVRKHFHDFREQLFKVETFWS